MEGWQVNQRAHDPSRDKVLDINKISTYLCLDTRALLAVSSRIIEIAGMK